MKFGASKSKAAQEPEQIPPAAPPSASLEEVTRTVFLFGRIGHGPYGFMTFAPDGKVMTYENQNEASYRYADGMLTLCDANGHETTHLKESPQRRLSFLPLADGWHYLEPVFSLGAPPALSDLPPVVVNTAAKAGTYMVAEALKEAGYKSLDLHLSSGFFHDNRGVAAKDMHWDPNERSVPCSASSIASLLRPGEFVLGHIDSLEELRKIDRMPAELIHVIREPRSQMLSMFTFKPRKVKPKPTDLIWQSMTGLDRFKAFLISFPAAYWLDFCRQITENFRFLRYEDLRQGVVSDAVGNPVVQSLLEKGLKTAVGKETSTYMGEDSDGDRAYFEVAEIVTYLDQMGISEFSRQHWPVKTDDPDPAEPVLW